MDIYAHRAGRGLAPENTLEACAMSLQFEIDFIDFDIGMTRDGQLVVTHDLALNPDITRGPDGKFITEETPVCEMSYSELSCFNVGLINPNVPYASYFPLQRPFPFARIPRLKDAIQYVQKHVGSSVGFQIEIKTDPTAPHLSHSPEKFAEALANLLRETGIIENTEVQAFDYRCLLALQHLDPSIKTAFLTHPFDHESSLGPWLAGHDLQKYGGSYPRLIHSLGGGVWGPFQMEVTQEVFLEAKALDLKVVVWGYPEKEGTDFNAQQIKKLITWGIDGIITDRPDLLRQHLEDQA